MEKVLLAAAGGIVLVLVIWGIIRWRDHIIIPWITPIALILAFLLFVLDFVIGGTGLAGFILIAGGGFFPMGFDEGFVLMTIGYLYGSIGGALVFVRKPIWGIVVLLLPCVYFFHKDYWGETRALETCALVAVGVVVVALCHRAWVIVGALLFLLIVGIALTYFDFDPLQTSTDVVILYVGALTMFVVVAVIAVFHFTRRNWEWADFWAGDFR